MLEGPLGETKLMNQELLMTLMIGAILMCVLIGVQMKWYGIKIWKSIVVVVSLVLVGVYGSQIWYFVENGNFGGRSFYGAIFLAPIAFFPVARILHESYTNILGLCAPAGCLTLALVKVQCLRDGCCNGYVMYMDENHFYVHFPSQIVEMITFLVIAAILFHMSHREKNREKIFAWFLILYGGTRFVLDFLRENRSLYALGLSAGSFWSMIAFGVGLAWLLIQTKKG